MKIGLDELNLSELEERAAKVAALIHRDQFAGSLEVNKIDVEEKTFAQLRPDLEVLRDSVKANIEFLGDNVADLESLLSEPVPSSFVQVDRARELISHAGSAVRYIEEGYNHSREVHDAYQQAQLAKVGFIDYCDVESEIHALITEEYGLKYDNFLGKLRYRKKIKSLRKRIDSLVEVRETQGDLIAINYNGYHEKQDFEKLSGQLFCKFAEGVLSDYESKINLLSEKRKAKPLTPEMLDSMADEYIAKYYKAEIDRRLAELRENENPLYPFNQDDIEVLSDPDKVAEALAVVKINLNTPFLYESHGSKEDHQETTLMRERYNALPNQFCSGQLNKFTSLGIKKNNFNSDMQLFNDYLLDLVYQDDEEKLRDSFTRAEEVMFSPLDDHQISGNVKSPGHSVREHGTKDIRDRLKPAERALDLYQTDMDQWDIFRNNPLVQQLHGQEALDSLEEHIRDNIYRKLISGQEGTNVSVEMGMKAYRFKDSASIAYNVLNFWRESGTSGEKTFLRIESKSSETLAAKYITSLTDEQVAAAAELNIPGLVDVIDLVKRNTDDFNDFRLGKDGKTCKNPTYS